MSAFAELTLGFRFTQKNSSENKQNLLPTQSKLENPNIQHFTSLSNILNNVLISITRHELAGRVIVCQDNPCCIGYQSSCKNDP